MGYFSVQCSDKSTAASNTCIATWQDLGVVGLAKLCLDS